MNPIDITQVARDFGLFVALVVACFIALGLVIRSLWLALREETNGRREDQKLATEDQKLATQQLLESARIMDRAVNVIGARRD